MTASTRCRLCESESAVLFGTGVVLRKHLVKYWRCENCGFVQTDEPHWVGEAYSDAITSIDIGPVNRSITMAEKARALILTFFDSRERFLDYGGGYGIFVRRMRDLGFDFRYYDKFCANLFAKGFEVGLEGNSPFELITAFEVVEHVQEPMAEFRKLLSMSDSIFFTTELMPARYPKPTEWWYYDLDHGQHISFYSRKSLKVVAKLLGVEYLSLGSLHLLTRRRISRRLYRLVLNARFTNIVGDVLGRYHGIESLLERDFERISGLRLDN
jgi:Methyltransferase domain